MDEELRAAIVQGDEDAFAARVSDVAIDASTESGRTLLHVAASTGRPAMAETLIELGAALDAQDGDGKTPLHLAIERDWDDSDQTDVARLLIEAGAPLDIEDRHGNHPLARAVTHGEKGLVALLIDNGANPNHENKHGQSPMALAQQAGRDEYITLMADAAARLPETQSDPDLTGFEAGHTHVALDEDVHAWIWEELVPLSGTAGTVQGELLRAVESLRSEARRNGNGNWGQRFEELLDVLEYYLLDGDIVPEARRFEIGDDIARLRNSEFTPYLDNDLYDRLADAVVTFCESNPELIALPEQLRFEREDLCERYQYHYDRPGDENRFLELHLEPDTFTGPVLQYQWGLLNITELDAGRYDRAVDIFDDEDLTIVDRDREVGYITVEETTIGPHRAVVVTERILTDVYGVQVPDIRCIRERIL